MTSGLMPLAGPSPVSLRSGPVPLQQRREQAHSRVPARSTGVVRSAETRTLACCALALALLLEAAVLFAPQALFLHRWQSAPAVKLASGYAMVAVLMFAMGFGWLRRLPAMVPRQRWLKELHQAGGLLVLLLLACHAAARPGGFLLLAFHAMAVGQGAGALRAVLGARAGRQAGTALLMLHIGLSCLVCGAALLHLWFVYAYTA